MEVAENEVLTLNQLTAVGTNKFGWLLDSGCAIPYFFPYKGVEGNFLNSF